MKGSRRSKSAFSGREHTLGGVLQAVLRSWSRPWLKWAFWAALIFLVYCLIADDSDVLTSCALGLGVAVYAANELLYVRDKRRVQRLRQSDSPPSLGRTSGLVEKQSVASRVTGRGGLVTPRQMPSEFRVFLNGASVIARRRSRDRSMLDLVLTIDDLPAGWLPGREFRFRVGLLHNDDWDKRARREKLVGAGRIFMNSETRSRVVVQVVPWATEEDVRSVLARAWAGRRDPWDSTVQVTDESEVTPPPEAGEHAVAWLISTISPEGASRTLNVVWPGPGSLLLGIKCSAPPEVEIYDLTSALIQRQRGHLALQGALGSG
jgi:hypothetical protein